MHYCYTVRYCGQQEELGQHIPIIQSQENKRILWDFLGVSQENIHEYIKLNNSIHNFHKTILMC